MPNISRVVTGNADEILINVPMWFLKLTGVLSVLVSSGFTVWAGWMTTSIIDVKVMARTAAQSELTVRVNREELIQIRSRVTEHERRIGELERVP